jgi:hypothetical protein
MTTITIPSLELAPVGNETAPSILLFSLVVDDMGTGESLKMKQYEHTQMSLSPQRRILKRLFSGLPAENFTLSS